LTKSTSTSGNDHGTEGTHNMALHQTGAVCYLRAGW